MREGGDVVVDIVEALAAVEGVDPVALDFALHEHVDTEALASLVAADHDGWRLTFEVPGHQVAVDADGRVEVDGDLVVYLDTEGVEQH